ncbi:MAG: hypothetical protein K0R36_2147 [Chryseobacterium sp.]|nr:hypothetical protein [Chryseobacterium sp.]
MVKKSLHNKKDFDEIIERISHLSEHSKRKWGKMNVAQMLCHCDLILQIALKKIELPKINFLFKAVGIFTKKEIQIFNNGIPHNMPSFQKVIVNFECDFEESKLCLVKTLNEYWEAYKKGNLAQDHALFGAMKEKDWGFLEYKHLNHHLKQFNV